MARSTEKVADWWQPVAGVVVALVWSLAAEPMTERQAPTACKTAASSPQPCRMSRRWSAAGKNNSEMTIALLVSLLPVADANPSSTWMCTARLGYRRNCER